MEGSEGGCIHKVSEQIIITKKTEKWISKCHKIVECINITIGVFSTVHIDAHDAM